MLNKILLKKQAVSQTYFNKKFTRQIAKECEEMKPKEATSQEARVKKKIDSLLKGN